MSEVVISSHDDVERGIAEALSYLPVEKLVRGRVVAVKPNDTYATPEDTTGVTQGETLRATLRQLKQYEPKKLIVTGGAGAAETEEVFELSGMTAALEEEGVEFYDHNKAPFEEVRLDYGPQRTVVVNPRVLTYEVVVALNQLKVHDSATVTLAMKNIAMSYPAADFYGHPRWQKLHAHAIFDDLQSFIAGMVQRFPITLAITVGHPAMIGTGPLGGHTFEAGLTIASTDAVAADAVGARILGFQPQAVRHIFEAGNLGLGETNLENIQIEGFPLREAIKRFTERAYGKPMTYKHA